MTEPPNDTNGARAPERFAERFELHELLGRGGMAEVYRATDLGSGRTVALKRLLDSDADERRGRIEMLFEREFHTLVQLSHPCVIEVYDYGVTPDGSCYYTMELLDGGALREQAPLPWRTACQLMFDVCSSLALLHSRRLLHRDISARNVHCTRDGHAKLIDFGAVAPMSSDGGLVVGTPAFTAPETVHRSATDGRTDLYSFGATLYYALTTHLAYPARTFSELFVRWNERPAPPSAYAPDIPPALDDLVMSLLALEPALRPPSAFSVMQRLAAIAGLQSREAESVSRGYLSTPALTGREALLARVREPMLRALSAGGRGVLLQGPPGIGRSRMLDACAIEAKTLGARVLRANARGTRDDFEVAFALAQHLVEAMPSEQLARQFPELFQPAPATQTGAPALRELSELRSSPEHLERALLQLMREASKAQPLVFAVDDVQRIDEPSAAVLAALIDRFRYGRAFVVMTVDSEASDSSLALDALSRRCDTLQLAALTQTETQSLFGSVFGDVPNLGHCAEEIYGLARGNPRASLDLAQHLVQREVITYAAGTWTLPRRLSPDDLPQSAEAAIRARIEQLDPLARFLAHAHALSFVERLTHSDYRALAGGLDSRDADAAVHELLTQQALVTDGEGYVLANRVWNTALANAVDATTRERAHAALARLFDGRVRLAWIHHALAGESGDAERAVDALLAFHTNFAEAEHGEALQNDVSKLARSFPRAIELAQRLGRPARQLHTLRHGLLDTAVASGELKYYGLVAPDWLGQLVHDSGLELWRSDAQNPDSGARLMQALTRAFERHKALPELERVYPPDQAIRHLAEYVAISIANGIRTMDTELLRSLPALLEPFAPLSPLLAALWQNAIGVSECHEFCHYELARSRWIGTHGSLKDVTGDELRHVTPLRNAIAYGIGMVEAVFGLASAARWADDLDQDPYQRVSALYLRKIVCLEQGDWTGAEKLQRNAELLALRARAPQMFQSTLTVEISAHALALDLAGVQDVIQRERVEAAQYPGWIPYVHEAEARFELIRGDFVEAKKCFDYVIELTAVNSELRSPALPVWVAAQSGLCETLLGLERPEEARTSALAALEVCEKLEIRTFANDIVRMLALAEAKLGDFASAVARLDRMIADQTALGVTGLRIGVSYEARAEVALWADDARGFDTYARLTAREYRRGAGCPLSARYERLTREARKRGIQPEVALTDFEPATSAESEIASLSDLRSVVRQAFTGAQGLDDRHARALRLVCAARAARGGHLFLPTPQGPMLAATCDLAPPGAALGQSVREYLEEEEDRFETQTIANADLLAVETRAPTAYADGFEYELLLLISTTLQGSEVAGVVALAPGERDVKPLRQSQLLASIAEQLTATRAQ